MTDEVDLKRREFLLKATSVVGGLGLAAITMPFLKSCQPSLSTTLTGEPIQVDISQLAAGEQLTIEWRGLPIWIVRRTQEEISALSQNNPGLRDPHSLVEQQPAYAQNNYRSIRPEILVLVGICTHLGCIPNFYPQAGSVNKDWQGGFLCPCHGSRFDMAGRVYKNVPAPINLQVPQYTFIDDNTLLIGVNHAG